MMYIKEDLIIPHVSRPPGFGRPTPNPHALS
jgi:hypothetical protein